MKKIVLSTVAVAMMATTGAFAASDADIAELKAMMKQMNQRLAKLETENQALKSQIGKNKKATSHTKKSTSAKSVHVVRHVSPEPEVQSDLEKKFAKATVVKSSAPVLKFSGLHYLGFVANSADYMDGSTSNSSYFETRRNYLQVKAYFDEDSKSYMRVTLDTHQIHNSVDDDSDINFGNTGDWEVRLKYAYLYLDDVLPYTGVEFGQAHRPWIDYAEHHGWWYRSIQKTFVEAKHGADWSNSADLGIDFKTKTEYFSSELGAYNGEGYHGVFDKGGYESEGNSLSLEWRLTGHILGTGEKHVHRDDAYADISFFGQYNMAYGKKGGIDEVTGDAEDFKWYGVHAVYNQPVFLLAAQYLKSNSAAAKYAGKGWSVNGEFRFGELVDAEAMHDMGLLARYDDFSYDGYKLDEKKTTIAGLFWDWNKNVEFVFNWEQDKTSFNYLYAEPKASDKTKNNAYLFTTQVKW
jgi:Ni/Co efflux regulator RcnB